jgi:outer membrane receptor for ferric coprogen and ferric-rhodotorulic acid
MRTPLKYAFFFYAFALLARIPLAAQSANASSSQPGPDGRSTRSQEVVELSPFEVAADKDVGYVAESSLSGSRLNSSLRDTPASIQVYTKEFISDIGAVTLQDVLNYSANVENGAGDEQAFFSGAFAQRGFINFQPRVRGLPSSQARDYFAWQLPIDTYITDRLDESRGPNALLFGIAAAGGIQNQSIKKAMANRDFGQITYRTDSYGLYRGEIDLNKVLVKDQLALRLNGLFADGDGWRKNTYTKNRAIHGAVTYKPDRKTTIRAAYESFQQHDSVSNTFVETDFLSQWLDAGTPVYDLFSPNRISLASANGTVSAANRDTVLRKAGVTTLGTNPQVAMIEGGSPSMDGQVVSLYRAMLTQQFRDTNGNGRYITAHNIARSESVFPYDVSFNGPANERKLDSKNSVVTVQRELIKDLFVEAGFAHYHYNWDSMPGGEVRGDANTYFAGSARTPATAVPNPNAGKAFLYSGNLTRWITDRKHETYRLTGTYAFDFAKHRSGFLSKLGAHQIALGVEHVDYTSNQPVLRLGWFDAATRRPAYDPSGPGGTNFVATMKYIDLNDPSTWTGLRLGNVGVPVADPLDPRRQIVAEWTNQFSAAWDVEQRIDAKMLSTQSSFLNKRFVVTAGYREDKGANKKFIYQLDDLNREWVRIGPDAFYRTYWEVSNFTAGAVFHLKPTFSVFYNRATNSNIPDAESVIIGSLDRPGQITSPGGGKGQDYGFMARLFGDRINVRLTRYQTRQTNALNGSGAAANLNNGLHDQVIRWWSDIGFGLPSDPATPRLFQDRVNRYAYSDQSEGYELQLTANFTRNWRGTLNYSYTDKQQFNVGEIENQWFDQTIEWATRTVQTWDTSKITQAWIDSGIIPTNSLNDFLLQNGTSIADLIRSAENWRSQNLIAGAPYGLRKHKFNFFTKYTFNEGRLKGLSLGGGYRYQGPNVMQWETDANGDRTRFYGKSNGYADAMVSYRTKMHLMGKDTVILYQVNVQNLFDRSDPTIARYLNESHLNPPDRLYLVEPRNIRFSATIDF